MRPQEGSDGIRGTQPRPDPRPPRPEDPDGLTLVSGPRAFLCRSAYLILIPSSSRTNELHHERLDLWSNRGGGH